MQNPVIRLPDLPVWPLERRLIFHRALLEWMARADDAQFDTLLTLRQELAAGQPCSLLRLYRLCLELDAKLLARWPRNLIERLRAANLPPWRSAAPGV